MPRQGLGNKNESGYAKRKRKQAEEQFIQSQKGALLKHFRPDEPDQVADSSTSVVAPTTPTSEENPHETTSSNFCATNNLVPDSLSNIGDIGLWPQNLTDQQRKFVVESGPVRPKLSEFPSNSENRHFSSNFYCRKMPNSEIVDRRWLIYSINLDSVFCFCCKLFSISSSTKLCSPGCNDWKHLGEILSMHESSVKHVECFQKWLEMENRLNKNQTIDRKAELIIDSEKQHWRNVLERLLSIIQFLGQRNMSLRGSEEIFEGR